MTTMTDDDLDALLSAPLPDRDAGAFSVRLMERIARDQARPARILSWISVAVLTVLIAAGTVFAARFAGRGGDQVSIPVLLTLLSLVLSYAVTQSARE